jgi:hypothetical protein
MVRLLSSYELYNWLRVIVDYRKKEGSQYDPSFPCNNPRISPWIAYPRFLAIGRPAF